MDAGSCSRAATRMRSPTCAELARLVRLDREAERAASAIAYHMPPYATSTVERPDPVHLEPRVELLGERGHVRQLDALDAAVAARGANLDDARRRLEPQRRLRLAQLDHARLEQHGRDADRVRARHRRVLGRLHDDVARAQSSRVAGTIRFACTATDPRGSRSSNRRSESSARSACICSKTVAPGGGSDAADHDVADLAARVATDDRDRAARAHRADLNYWTASGCSTYGRPAPG